jgi:hypothetical protein
MGQKNFFLERFEEFSDSKKNVASGARAICG